MTRVAPVKRVTPFDRYLAYREQKWGGRDLVTKQAAKDLLFMRDPVFFSKMWRRRAVLNDAVKVVLKYEKMIRKIGAAKERVHVTRPSPAEAYRPDEEEDDEAPDEPKVDHFLAEADTVSADEWIGRLERAKRETIGQKRELNRLWGEMQKELSSYPQERLRVEKHFMHDRKFQMLLNMEGIEEV
jgi:hypothetical protein